MSFVHFVELQTLYFTHYLMNANNLEIRNKLKTTVNKTIDNAFDILEQSNNLNENKNMSNYPFTIKQINIHSSVDRQYITRLEVARSTSSQS